MLRRIFSILASLSLLLCVSLTVFWIRNLNSGELFTLARNWQYSAYVVHSQLQLGVTTTWIKYGFGPYLRKSDATQWTISHDRFPGADDVGDTNIFGFGIDENDTDQGSLSEHIADNSHLLIVPTPLIVVLTAATPALWWINHRRKKRRAKTTLCPNCGYDLRATPNRCPECGTLATQAPT